LTASHVMRISDMQVDVAALTDLYVNQELSAYAIGQRYGVSAKTLLKVLRNNKIAIRNGSEAPSVVASHRSINVQNSIRDKVRYLYCEQYLTQNEITRQLHTSTYAVSRCLRQLGCLRTREESKALRGTIQAIETHHGWKGERKVKGYIYSYRPEHSRAKRQNRPFTGYVPQHILVWEEVHNKPLPIGWVVHHLNGIRNDNRPSNLVALTSRKHNMLIGEFKKRIRQLEIEKRQLQRALEDSQMVFYINEN